MSQFTTKIIDDEKGTIADALPSHCSFDDEISVPPAEREQADAEEANFPVLDKSSNERLEKAQELHEANTAFSAEYCWQHRPDWKEDESSRKINPMHYQDFITKLQLAGVMVEANNFTRVGRIGINACPHGIWKYITTLQYPYSYEYSVMRFNEYRVPTNEKFRGWRTALLHLIAAGVLSKEKALAVFGPPQGPAAETYLKELQALDQ
jgi:hypothetical protein